MNERMNENSVRNYKLDNMKALLIFLVVLGHLLECFGGERKTWLYLVIYSFHMPAFIYITGYFSRFKPERLVFKLCYSYLVYQVLYLLFQRYCLGQENTIQFATPYWILWYLMSMIIWTLLLQVVDETIFSKKVVVIAAVSVALLSGFDNSVGYYLSLSRTLVFLPFFVLGYLRTFDCIIEWGGLKQKVLCCAVLCLLLCLIWRMRGWLQGGWFYQSMSYNAGGYSVWIRTGQLLVACMWIVALQWLIPSRKIRLISSLGQYTLPVYLVHGFLVRLIGKHQLFGGSEEQNLLLAVLLAMGICVFFGNKYAERALRVTFSLEWVKRKRVG